MGFGKAAGEEAQVVGLLLYKGGQIILHGHTLFKDLERITLIGEPLNGAGKGIAQPLYALEGVVEGYYGAVAGVALDIGEHILGGHPFGVVASHEVPHNYAVFTGEPEILVVAHPSMWGTEQIGVEQLVGFLSIGIVGLAGMAEASHVVEGVVAYAVTFAYHLSVEFGVFPYIVANHEEGGLDTMLAKHGEDERCSLGDRAIIEG